MTGWRSPAMCASVGLAVVLGVSGPFAGTASAAGSTIDTVTPNVSANSNAAQQVTFSGYSVAVAPSSATLTSGGTTITGAINSASTTSTTATFNLSGKPTGSYTANLSFNGLPEASCSGTCFTLDQAPTVTAINPTQWVNDGPKSFTVTGSGFVSGQSSFRITHAGQADIVATNVQVTPTSMSGTLDLTAATPTAASWAVVVTNSADTGTATCTCTFTLDADPTVATVSPSNGLNDQAYSVTVTGTGFVSGSSSFRLRHASQSDIVATNVHVTSSTSMSGTLDLTAAPPLDGWAVVVTNSADGGSATCATGACMFSIGAASVPSISGASPADLGQGATPATTVTINGSGFAQGATVQFADTAIHTGAAVVTSLTQLTVPVTVTAGAVVGASPFTVKNVNNDSATCTTCFTVDPAPTVGAPSPANAGIGAVNRSITVAGTGFRSGATVSFSGNGITVGPAVVNSSTSITVPISVAVGANTGTRDVTVTNADGSSATNPTAFTIDAAPTVGALSPASRAQGTSGTEDVPGTGFVSGATVTVGNGVTAGTATVNSPTDISVLFTVDASAPSGARTVTVTNPDGGVGTGSFTVGTKPTISSVTPSTVGRGASARTITVVGANFASDAAISITQSGVTVGSTSFVDSAHLTADVTVSGTATLGPTDVTVTNPDDGGTAVASGGLTITAAPTPTNLAPEALGQGASGATVVVTGTGFAQNMTATFDGLGVSVDDITVSSATQATLHVSVTSTAAPGTRALTLTNTDGGTSTTAAALTVDVKPVVSAIAPTDAPQGATVNVDITGTGFASGMSISLGTGITVSSVNVTSGTAATATVVIAPTAATTGRSATATNQDGGTSTSAGTVFTVDPSPTITSTTPSTVSNSGSPHNRSITFTGTGFTTGPVAMKLTMAGQPDVVATSANATSGTSAAGTFVLEALKAGSWAPVLTNPDGSTATCTCVVTVLGSMPTVVSITPSSAGQGATGISVAITGTNFANGATVTFSDSGVTASNVVVTGATHLTATVDVAPGATPSARDVTVTNADTQAGTLTGGFTVTPAPVITAFSPAARAQGTTTPGVALSGTGFASGMTVDLGSGITVSAITVTSATAATATVAVAGGAPTGAHAATALNLDGGTSTTPAAFTVDAAPTVSTATPALGQGAAGRTVTVTGTGLVAGATVTFAKSGATGTVTAGTSTVAADGKSLTVPVSVSSGATTGAYDVTVTNADGGTATAAAAFTVDPKPTVTGVSPTIVGRGYSGPVTISGTGFASGPTVTADGTGVTFAVTHVTATAITATLTVTGSATLGTRTVTVANADGGSAGKSAALTVTAAPTVTSVTPTLVDGATQTATVHGGGFTGTPTVVFGSGITATGVVLVDAGTLTVTVTVPATAPIGGTPVAVTNADGGSGSCAACANVVGRSALTVKASPASLVAGRSTKLAGSLRDIVRGPLDGKVVALFTVNHGALAFVGSTTTSPAGAFAFTVKPKRDVTYAVGFAGDGSATPAGAVVTVKVAWAVSVVNGSVGKHTASGAVFTVTVASSPNAAGATAVLLERHANGTFSVLATAKVGSNGRARLAHALRTGAHTLVVRIRPRGGNETGSTPNISVRIR